jgi:uroporphyrinogen decarboxylase
VKRCIDAFASGGGYVAAAIHNIRPEVPPENIVAMVEAVHEYGRYS